MRDFKVGDICTLNPAHSTDTALRKWGVVVVTEVRHHPTATYSYPYKIKSLVTGDEAPCNALALLPVQEE